MKEVASHIAGWFIVFVLSLSFGVVIFWAIQNYINPGFDMIEPRVIGPTRLKNNDVLQVSYKIVRRRDCTLQVTRILQSVSGQFKGRETQLVTVEQSFKADNQIRDIGYAVELPSSLPEDPDVNENEYDVFNRVRFFCNGLDWLWPRYMTTPRLRITITRE